MSKSYDYVARLTKNEIYETKDRFSDLMKNIKMNAKEMD